jgi:hypothetical protein
MTDFNLRATIREVVESSGLTDPGDIAAKVAENVPQKLLRTVLADALRDVVRIELHSYTSWRRPEPEPNHGRSPSGSRSAKVAAYRVWARILRKPVAVEGNEWKAFGECGPEDLSFLAQDRRQNAAESLAAAERFEKYAAALEEAGAETVADLPDAVIASIEDGQP